MDPAVYSKYLMTLVRKYVPMDPLFFLQNPKALLETISTNNPHMGSSTCSISTLDPDSGMLKVANLGDSGFVLLRRVNRKFKIVSFSHQQQHEFNVPYQIGTDGDNASEANSYEVKVREGDIVIMGTDGLFDNLFRKDIERIVNQTLQRENGIEDLAEALSSEANLKSLDESFNSPFSMEAKKQGLDFQGGKEDDITVVVAEVVRNQV